MHALWWGKHWKHNRYGFIFLSKTINSFSYIHSVYICNRFFPIFKEKRHFILPAHKQIINHSETIKIAIVLLPCRVKFDGIFLHTSVHPFCNKRLGSLHMHKYFCDLQMFTEYGPDFELDLQAGNKVNRNTNEYIEVVLQQVEGRRLLARTRS